jgi:hypothetical protein
MQPLDRPKSRESASPRVVDPPRTAEIISLAEWRQRHRRPGFRWRRGSPMPLPIEPARRRTVPIEAWLMALIVFSAAAGAVFALMGLGYLP